MGLENALRRPQEASRRPQEPPRGLKTPSRALQGASRRLQEHSKTLQDGSKSAQEASRRPQERSKRRQDGAKSVPRGLETPQERSTWLKTAPRALQEASRRLKASSSLCEATRRHSKCAFKITFEEDVRRSVRSSCSFPLSSIGQAAGQPAPCILCTGSL